MERYQFTEEQNKKWHNVIDRDTPVEEIRYNYSGLKYVQPAYVIRQLNEAFDQWDFEVLDSDIKNMNFTSPKGDVKPVLFAVVHGRMTVPGLGSREQFGCQNIVAGADGLSESLKMASSDCMKKCASMFGICRDLYESDPNENQQKQGTFQPKAQGTFQPKTQGTFQAKPQGTFQPKPAPQAQAPAPAPKPQEQKSVRDEMTNDQKLQLAKIRTLLVDLGKDTSESKQAVYSDFLGRKVSSFKELKADQYQDLITYLEGLVETQA